MFAWANSRTAAPKSALGKAFTYLKEQWPYLTNYLKDGRLELSNNRAERSIKPFVIDRKNFLFANTPKGAKGSAMMFSLIQTAIENGLDPYKYLTWLLKTANTADMGDIEVTRRPYSGYKRTRKFSAGIRRCSTHHSMPGARSRGCHG